MAKSPSASRDLGIQSQAGRHSGHNHKPIPDGRIRLSASPTQQERQNPSEIVGLINVTIILDAHLLLLLIVGTTSRDYIAAHRRLRAYTAADFTLLTRLLTAAAKIVVTPNTLTETSNLVAYIAEPARTRIYQTFRAIVAADGTEERYAESKVAVNRKEFERIGLTGLLPTTNCHCTTFVTYG